jgi:hypothetical protein
MHPQLHHPLLVDSGLGLMESAFVEVAIGERRELRECGS